MDANGITLFGVHTQKGGVLAIPPGADLNAFLHFQQVEKVTVKAATKETSK